MAVQTDWSRRTALREWLTANGIEPNTVPVDGDLTIVDTDGGRVIRCEVYALAEDGRLQLDDRGVSEARETRTVPLVVEPPVWWTPYEKPTREQLLAAVERVRKLHAAVPDHGRFTDGTCPNYCDGSHEEPPVCLSCRTHAGDPVAFPCDTVRALDGEDQH